MLWGHRPRWPRRALDATDHLDAVPRKGWLQGLQNRPLLHLSAREQSGFTIEDLSAENVLINDTIAALHKMQLKTLGSTLGDTLALHYSTYRDFHKFTDRVSLDHFPMSKGKN
jgi:hypothetical protein